MSESFLNDRVHLHCGDCRDVLAQLEENSLDACVTDPPYSLISINKRFGKPGSAPAKSDGPTGVYARASRGFMSVQWDTGKVAFDPECWAQVLRGLKPGAFIAAFGGDRTYHRLVCAIEDAGAEIRHTIGWVFGSGFPKNHSIAKDLKDIDWCTCDDD
jgi:DNA modification methylase